MSAPARRIEVSVSRIAGLAVDPAVGGGGLDHGVLAGDVVRRHRHVDRVADPAHDVEVGQRRLHHHDVGALGDVEQRLADALDGRWRGPAGRSAGRPRARSRRPRGTGRRTRRRTSRSRPGSRRRCGRRRRARRGSRATWPSIIPLGPTMSTPASAWASAISAYASSVASLSTRPSAVEHAAVAVVGELVEAQVAHHGERVADLGDHVGDRDVEDAVGVDGAGAGRRPSSSGMPNSITPPSPSSAASATALQQRDAGVLDDARHRRDRPRLVEALAHEQRQHQLPRLERGLGDQPAQRRRASAAGAAGPAAG